MNGHNVLGLPEAVRLWAAAVDSYRMPSPADRADLLSLLRRAGCVTEDSAAAVDGWRYWASSEGGLEVIRRSLVPVAERLWGARR